MSEKGGQALEMLKMKEPPGMSMKTQARGQNVHPKNGLFTRKCTNCATIGNILPGLLTENPAIAQLLQKIHFPIPPQEDFN